MISRGAVETYLHWLQWRLGHALVDDLMSPDQAVAWHELCRELRLGPEPLAEDIDEAELAGAGALLETWLEGQVPEDRRGLWMVGPARTGVCTLLHDLVLGICARPRAHPQIPIPLLICGNTTRASICMLGLTGPWHGLTAAEAIDRWWSAVELDLRRYIDRSWRAAPLRGPGLEPLVILGGVDELREPAALQTVVGWARELATAGVRVIVSSRDAELPEQAQLCELEASEPAVEPPRLRSLAWAERSAELHGADAGEATRPRRADGPGHVRLADDSHAHPRPPAGEAHTNARHSSDADPHERSTLDERVLNERLDEREANEQPRVRDANERLDEREANERPPVRDANERPPVRDANERPPVRDANDRPPVRDAIDPSTVRDADPAAPRPLLRRLFVLPLTRPPIDRFLARWARIDGAWGRVVPDRLHAALAARPALTPLSRRPADLAVLAVLSSGKAELPDSLADLHRALLGALDLGHPAHRQLLARVVADPDSALDMPTRRAWLAALVAVAVACDHVDLGEALGRDVRLGPTGSHLLLAATRAWAEGGCPLRPVLADSPVRVPRARCADGHDDEMARLIWLGHHAGWWGPEAIFVLRRAVPARERLVDLRPSALRPRPLLLALAALEAAWGPCVAPLLRALPLGLLLAEGGTLGPVTASALYADNPPAELRPVRELFHRFLELELALVSLAADDTTLQSIVMEMAASRDLDLDGALDLVLAQEGVGPRRPRSPAGRDESSERGAYLDLALNLAARLTPCGAPALVADLERARRAAIHYSDCFTGVLRARLEQLAGFLIVLLIYAIDRRLLQPARTTLRRSEVFALQQLCGAPERVAAGFPGERRSEVAEDWRWVMRQPWAPHRIAGHLLARMPETLELDPEAVLPRCHAWLRAWLAEADVAA